MVAKRKNRVRVISGALKGRLLAYPTDRARRPTMQRTKSSVFESLGDRLRNAVFIDLYAAAGGIGIEAISRGAGFVHFVENDRRVLGFLRGNLDMCGVGPERARVHAADVLDFLGSDSFRSIAPDIVYADPPYGKGEIRRLIEFFDGLSGGAFALLILEHERDLSLEGCRRLERTKMKTFGQTRVSFLVTDGR